MVRYFLPNGRKQSSATQTDRQSRGDRTGWKMGSNRCLGLIADRSLHRPAAVFRSRRLFAEGARRAVPGHGVVFYIGLCVNCSHSDHRSVPKGAAIAAGGEHRGEAWSRQVRVKHSGHHQQFHQMWSRVINKDAVAAISLGLPTRLEPARSTDVRRRRGLCLQGYHLSW